MSTCCDSLSQCVTLVEILQRQAADSSDSPAYTLLANGESEAGRLTWAELDAAARAVAVLLARSDARNQRVLLLYPPGLEFIAGFLGCLYGDAVAVPVYPPESDRSLPRLVSVVRDAQPSLVLTTSSLLPKIETFRQRAPELGTLRCLATDTLEAGLSEEWVPAPIGPESLAFLQYTSGSTAAPKGVVVSHGNLVHNQEMIRRVCAHTEHMVMVSWLPPYHDMGLIAGLLQPLYVGGRCVLMPPIAFLQKPLRWLEAITRYRGTTSGGPNFAYDLCVRKVSAEDRRQLDLSSWRVAFNGAEPVRAETIERFARVFSSCGFDRHASYPCYGLAEATLFVTGVDREQEPLVEWFDPDALEQNRVAPVTGMRERVLVSCGRPRMEQQLRIVDPDSHREVPPDRVGEIWVAGASVAKGYWQKPEETARDFTARLAGDPEAGPFLRTGDLGFLWQGELFVTGRLKDLIIIRGRNRYPQDLELTAVRAHPQLRPGGGAAFAVETDGEERLVVVHEVQRRCEAEVDVTAVTDAVRRAASEEHEVHVWDVVLIPAGSLPKTSSGKVRRRACRGAYLAGELPVIGSGRAAPAAEQAPPQPALRGGELLGLSGPERLPRLTEHLRGRLAQVVGSAPQGLDPDRPLTALGLDSLRAVELASELEEQLGAGPSQARLLEGATLREVAAEVLAALESGAKRIAPAPAAVAEDHPLSRGQRALWFLEQLHPGTTAYLLSGALRLRGTLDAAALRGALERLVARHPALRTTFTRVAGEPRQVVRKTMRVELVEDEGARLAELAYRAFDLERGPLFRLALVRRSAAEQVLLVTVHHLISDLWSIGIFLDELEALYREETGGPAAGLPALPVAYTDYVHWQEEVLAGERGPELEAVWHERLSGELPVLDLPTDRPRPAVPTLKGELATRVLDRELRAGVEALGERSGATLFMTLTAALQLLLHRYAGQDEVLLGAPTSGRSAPELQGLIGYFVNPVVLRGELGDDPAFDTFLARTRQVVLAAFAHQDYPFPLLAERLRPERDASHTPILQAMLVLQQTRHSGLAAAALGEEGARLELFDLPCETLRLPCRDSQFDLTLYVAPWDDRLGLALEYSAELFDVATARRLLGHFRVLLQGLTAEPGCRLSELPLMTDAERAQLLVEWNDTGSAPAPACLHELVTAQVRRTPTAPAVVCGRTGTTLTYRQLERRSAALSAHLRHSGVGPEVRVGVCLPRTPELVVALLGVLRAGGAYVPIDPEYPAERQAFMLEDSAARILVSDSGLVDRLPAGVEILFLDQLPRRAPAGATRGVGVDASNLSHLIYTSGSTGVPKGVAIRHAAAVAMVRWSLDRYGPEELRGVLLSTSVCFDISVFEIFVPLACGGRVIVAENALELPQLAARDQVTLINTVPSAMTELVRQDAVPSSVRTVNLAGEPLKRELVDGAYATGTVERVFNLYGPSEDTTYTTWVQVPRAGHVTIGRPLIGTRISILDRSGRPVPVGVRGELYLAGDGLARGYLLRPRLTAERFLPDPFVGEPGRRLYRTGDLVRYRPDGELDFLGRIDTQVKVRGFRIELGEIESALLTAETVRECVVVAREQSGRGTMLVAYVAGESPQREPLQQLLRRRLPEQMVPAVFVELDRLPLLPNGKVDRRALPAPDWSALPRDYVAPQGPVEELLAGIWAEVLKRERVGRNDNFFELGGHSLLATQVVSRIRQALAVELPLRELFAAPTLAAQAAKVAAARRGHHPAEPPLVPIPRSDRVPLSFAQERLWFLEQLDPGKSRYNVCGAVRLVGPLNVATLQRSLREIVRRHESLRTTFGEVDGVPVQVIARHQRLELPLVELAFADREVRDKEVRRLAEREARRPFDLTRGPLLRVLLLRLEREEHVLVLNMHHIVSDGWSIGLFIRELGTLSTGGALPPLPVQYPDFALWQRQWLGEGDGEGVLEREMAWWQELLEGRSRVLELPTDRPRPPIQSLRGAQQSIRLSPRLTQDLETLARRHGVTPFMVLLAGFSALLHRTSGQQDVLVGSPVAGRNRQAIEDLIGFFVNTLVLPVALTGNPPFGELLQQVREVALGAYDHQNLPFEKLVEALQPERDLSRSPLFQVMLALQNTPMVLELPGLAVHPLEVQPGTAQFDLALNLRSPQWQGEDGSGGAMEGAVFYCRDLFDATTMRRFADHFAILLQSVVGDPERRVAALPLLAAGERQQLLAEWPGDPGVIPEAPTVQELFAARAQQVPETVAIVCGERAWSYRQLNARANQLARHLRALGVGLESRVGIAAERSPEVVVGILGILKAGGVCLPVDPGQPSDRQAFMIDDAGVRVLLVREAVAGLLPPPAAHGAELVLLDGPQAAILDRESTEDPKVPPVPDGLAYVIYTSGTTGVPKGVAVSHRQVLPTLSWFVDFFSLDEHTRVLQTLSPCFDFGVLELLTTLLAGGTLCFLPPDEQGDPACYLDAIARHELNTVHATPSFFRELIAQGRRLPRLEIVHLGGEALSRDLVREIAAAVNGPCRLYNGYGPTETSINSTIFRLRGRGPDRGLRTPVAAIGRATANHLICVLDRRGRPQPMGVPGELGIGGDGLARGYLHRPALTAERFVPDPFAPRRDPRAAGARLYRSGDLVRFLPDGNLEFLGRIDHQVKVRGFRIELEEIEVALLAHEAVKECVVGTREGRAGTRLVAYLVAAAEAPTRELAAFLRERLPDYMVPAAFVTLDRIPLTPNGKIDRRRLPAPGPSVARRYEPPMTATEQELGRIFCEVLKLERAGRGDDFFALGGHSLLATRVASRVRETFVLELSLRTFFEAPTLAALAQRIDAGLRPAADGGDEEEVPLRRVLPPIRALARSGGLPPSAVPLSFAQQRLWFLEELAPGNPFYNSAADWWIKGRLDVAALEASLAEIVRRHEMLRTVVRSADGEPEQIIRPAPAGWSLPVVDLAALPEARRRAEAERLAAAEGRRPFDLTHDLMLRATLLRWGDRRHRLFVTLHHIASDGWSWQLLLNELVALYEAPGTALPELRIQYADFAVWQRQWLSGEVLAAELAYWQDELAGGPLLELPTDRPRPALQRFRGGCETLRLPAAREPALAAIGRRYGATLFMTLKAAFDVLLWRATGQRDLVAGTPIANRNHAEIEALIGFFVNSLVLRTRLPEGADTSFPELLARVRELALGAYAHQDLPFEKLVEHLHPERDLSRNPIFQVLFALQNAVSLTAEMGGLVLEAPLEEAPTTRFDLEVHVGQEPAALVLALSYDRDLFDATTIKRMARQYATLLEAIARDGERRLGELPLLTAAARHQLLVEWSTGPAAPADGDGGLDQLVAAQAQRTPEAVAVAAGAVELRYRELLERAVALARHLRELGCGPDAVVGLCAERSPETMVAVLAILAAGGACLPLDPSYPGERLAFMLADSGAPLVLARRSAAPALPETSAQVVWLDDPEGWEGLPLGGWGLPLAREGGREGRERGPGGEWLSPSVAADRLAYVLYTSGSTGRPKGVAMPHRPLVNLVRWQMRRSRGPLRTLQLAPLSFDVAFQEIFSTWGAGGTLVLVDEDRRHDPQALVDHLRATGVERLFLPFVALRQLAEAAAAGPELPALVEVITAGEQLQVGEALRRFSARQGGAMRLDNQYGPTETHVVTAEALAAEPAAWPPLPSIGRPVAGVEAVVLAGDLRPLPPGAVGEILLGGIAPARGYLGRPALTAGRFVPHPYARRPGERLYRTGDLGRHLGDGRVQFLGRCDQQLKMRGFRVEPGEVEATIDQHPAVQQTAVAAVAPDALAAYVVLDGPREQWQQELMRHARQRLPEYLVPTFWVRLEALPRLPSGKVDRRALPAPDRGGTEDAAGTPRTSTEQTVAAIWCEVLERRSVGVDDNFFDVGGHSLRLIQVRDRLHRAFGRKIPVAELFRFPTVRRLADFLARGDAPPEEARVPAPAPSAAIAVIGMAGRFPGADDVDALWELVAAGREGLTHFRREQLLAAGVPRALVDDPRYVPVRGVIEDNDRFDADLFQLSPREAQLLDPQHRLFLEEAWEALENAGYAPQGCADPVGVFAGVSPSFYLHNLLADPELVEELGYVQLLSGNRGDFLPTRVSYHLDLKGPSINVQTACSTSLVAVHLACRSLLDGECRMALVGGVTLALRRQGGGYLYEQGGILSPDGRCRAFDAAAAGTVGGDGVAVVVLKRLADAIADGDAIRAVIRGSAVNNDGSFKVGFTAPGVEGQTAVVRAAHVAAGVGPETIGYVETHGTGTRLGDPIEIAALQRAFGTAAQGDRCALGSIKTNIGHLDSAAGVAGLIKAVLALEHRQIPPSLHFERPNPEVDFAAGPFYVATELADWPAVADRPRRAGVSSFAMGGTNAHAVLEEAPAPAASGPSRPWQLLVVSARTPAALETSTERLAAHLDAAPEATLADVAFTLRVGRRAFEQRRIVVCRDREDAVRALRGEESGRLLSMASPARKVAFLLPGIGEHYPGMGAGLYAQEAVFRDEIGRCVELTQSHLGCDLRRLLFPEGSQDRPAAGGLDLRAMLGGSRAGGDASEELERTGFLHPAVFALEYALAKLWMSWGVRPAAMLGHSLGEYVAACLAGVFPLADALELVCERARLIGELPGGAMLAVTLPEDQMGPYLGAGVSLSAVNSPEVSVVAG
ncbi:MAG: amino acid adenylation domain-containing protein, partial [bacterium]|nr:amino acid adenylation domain-containing protein [bacterium]